MAQFVNDCEEAYNEYKVYSEMSFTLSKVSKKVRKDEENKKGLDNLHKQFKNVEFHAGRRAKKLAGSKTIFYMRSGSRARLFFRYSEKEKGTLEVVGESNKKEEDTLIKNIKRIMNQ